MLFTTFTSAPCRRKVSYQNYLEIAPETRIAEWANGEALIYPPHSLDHQNLVGFITSLLGSFTACFQLGTTLHAPFIVKLWPEGPAREPDLLFISQENQNNLTPKQFNGAPDLVVEIISPSSVTEDRVRKFTEYEQAGVREYWLIDPRLHQQQADFYVLDETGILQPAPVSDAGIYTSAALPHFWIDIAILWQSPLPNPQLILADVLRTHPDVPQPEQEIYQALYDSLAARQS
ncbi:MAG TPA: Uma2 family endonuclease [Anaerolineae bacterium]|nr:Uma2 family endonuclease [Anaerolineae bacterium]